MNDTIKCLYRDVLKRQVGPLSLYSVDHNVFSFVASSPNNQYSYWYMLSPPGPSEPYKPRGGFGTLGP